MYKIKQTPKGHYYIETRSIDVVNALGGFGICDNCNKQHADQDTVYLVPVLNHMLCQECMDKFQDAPRYESDREYEMDNLEYFRINLKAYESNT